MNRLCPKCGQRFRADVALCPVHRAPLVDDPFIGRTLGDYAIKGFLGQGAMGVVYRADPPAAIKILNVVRARMQPELVRRFELEAKAIARLESPHIVRLYDAGTTGDGHLYITMELLRGQTLDELIRARRTLGPERAADVVFQAATALGEAHQKWVVHRDIKPDNLFIEPAEGGRPFTRVLDFGVVRINSDSVARSITGTVAGTPAYMSPEQLKSEKDIDGRTDIYSLGVVLYQALAGRNPFQGEGLMQTIQRHLYEPVPPLPADVPLPLAELTLRMLAKVRDERPQTMQAVCDGLVAAGFAQPPPVRLAGDVGVDRDPEARVRTMAGLETDPAFRRARQITPVARPVDPPSIDDDELPLPPPPDGGGSYIERGPGAPPTDDSDTVSDGPADPWRPSAPPADRPSIDAPPPTRPPSTQPKGFAAITAEDLAGAALDETVDSAPDLRRPDRTWAGPASIDLRPPDELDLDPRPPGRWRGLAITAVIFGLGAASGIWFARQTTEPPQPGVMTSAADTEGARVYRLRTEARDALDRQDWTQALALSDELMRLRPDDAQAAELRARARRESDAAAAWRQLLDSIAEERWATAEARLERIPPESTYRAQADSLAGLVARERGEALLDLGFVQAHEGRWESAAGTLDQLAGLPTPPARMPLLDQAVRRKRFQPSEFTALRLAARTHMNRGDYRLAITRLDQAEKGAVHPDERRMLDRMRFVCHRALGDDRTALDYARRWLAAERDRRHKVVIADAITRLEGTDPP